MEQNNSKISRRDFLKYSGATFASLALADTIGCTSLVQRDLPRLSKDAPLVLINANIVDVRTGKLMKERTIVIDRDRITAITDGSFTPPEKCNVINVNDRFVIPGLIDGHCHTTLPSLNGFYMSLVSEIIEQNKRNYTQQLYNGVTSIRDTGAFPKLLDNYNRMIGRGGLPGPRVHYCNQIMNIDRSHPDIKPKDISPMADMVIPFTGNPNAYFTDTADLLRKLEKNQESRPQFIKLTMDNRSVICGKGEIPVYTDEHLRIINDFAAKHNIPTGAHIHTLFGFKRALEFGINNLEHSLSDHCITPEEAAALAARKISTVPTLIVGEMLAAEEPYDEMPVEFRNDFIDTERKVRREFIYRDGGQPDYALPGIFKVNRELLKNYKLCSCAELIGRKKILTKADFYFGVLKCAPQNLLALRDAGVLIGCGTDAGIGFVYHGLLWMEMEIYARIGMPNDEILRCATLNNAKIMGMEDRIGSIEAQKLADLVVLRGNPLESISACRQPLMVIKGGELQYTSGTMTKTKNTITL